MVHFAGAVTYEPKIYEILMFVAQRKRAIQSIAQSTIAVIGLTLIIFNCSVTVLRVLVV
jgi:hypothetical protein